MTANQVNQVNSVRLNLFGRWLAACRAEEGLTQEELADKIGVSNPVSVCGWERGRWLPSVSELTKISKSLNVSLVEATSRHWGTRLANGPFREMALHRNFQEALFHCVEGVGHGWVSAVLGTRLKAWRGERTQKQAAAVLDVSKTSLSQVENGRSLLGGETLTAWSEKTRIPLSELAACRAVDLLVRDHGGSSLDFPGLLEEAARMSRTGVVSAQRSNLFGDLLKAWRGERTQKQAAAVLDVSKISLSQVETGGYLPAAETLAAWSEKTRIPLSELAACRAVDLLVREHDKSSLDFADVFGKAARMSRTGVVSAQRSNLFGERLKAWRGGRMQKDATAAIGVSSKFLSHVETGSRLPEAETLAALSKKTRIPLSELAASWIIDQAVREYGRLNLNLKIALKAALSVLPAGLSNGMGLAPLQEFLSPSGSFFLNKVSQLLQEQGLSLQDTQALKNIAVSAGIPPQAFQKFLRGNPVRDFLAACRDEDVLVNLARQLGYSASQLIGHLGIDLAFAYERSQGRIPNYMAHARGNGTERPGYDLDSRNPETGEERKIEVTASSTVSPFYFWSPQEWETLEKAGSGAYLLLILHAGSPDPTFLEIQNPTAQLESWPYGKGRLVSFRTVRRLVESRGKEKNLYLPGIIQIPHQQSLS